MPAAIPEIIKSKVIQQRLQGMSRDDIARANNISQGAVSNIIKEWTLKIGEYDAEALLELAKGLKSSGLLPVECANGLIMMNMLEQHGIDVDNSDLEEFISNKIVENKVLDDRRQALSEEISKMAKERVKLIWSYESILEKRNTINEELTLFFQVKQELDKHKISITEDLPTIVKTVKIISESGNDPKQVLEKFEDLQHHEDTLQAKKIAIDEKERRLTSLNQQESSIKRKIIRYSFNLSVYDELDRSGIGANKLRILLHTVQDVAAKNKISIWLAVPKFFRDIETQYDPKLGFESEIERLEIRSQVFKEKIDEMLETICTLPFIGPTIAGLYQRGLFEKEILKLAEILHGVLNRTFSGEDLTKTMISTINIMTTTMTNRRNTQTAAYYQKNVEILNKAKTELEQLEFPA
jgi:hypothetical protein